MTRLLPRLWRRLWRATPPTVCPHGHVLDWGDQGDALDVAPGCPRGCA